MTKLSELTPDQQSAIHELSKNHIEVVRSLTVNWTTETTKSLIATSLALTTASVASAGTQAITKITGSMAWPILLFGLSSIFCVLCQCAMTYSAIFALKHLFLAERNIFTNNASISELYIFNKKPMVVATEIAAHTFGLTGITSLVAGIALIAYRSIASIHLLSYLAMHSN